MNDSNTKKIDKGKLRFIIGIPVVLLLIVLRFVLIYYRSDGFSGISTLLPMLLTGFILLALTTSGFFAAWVYQDCKKRNEDGLLWALVTFIATPFIGLLIYFLRRPEIKQNCPSCGHRISLMAKYCEECGSHIKNKENITMEKQRTHHLSYIIAGGISLILMLACLTGFIVTAAKDGNVNTSAASDERVWNFGVISMNHNKYQDGVWTLDFKSASDGFISEEDFTIKNTETDLLHADISCGRVPDGASLTLWLVQGDTARSVDVTHLSEPLEYALNEFENGAVHVRLQINGVKDTTAEIRIE